MGLCRTRTGPGTASRRLVAIGILATLAVAGCTPLRRATVPLRTVRTPACAGDDRLLVLLPGNGSVPEDYERHGYVRAARRAGVKAAIVAADTHFAYFLRRELDTRLEEDVLVPARALGTRHVWFAGISLGGLGSIIVAYSEPEQIDGLLLLSPYLGPDKLIREIEAAGGVRHWSVPPNPTDFERLWGWLKGYATVPQERPPLVLAYGLGDRFARAHRLLAAVLPADRVLTTTGGHNWATWDRLWPRVLRQPVVAEALGPAAHLGASTAGALSECRDTR